jgi:hypothetical protein
MLKPTRHKKWLEGFPKLGARPPIEKAINSVRYSLADEVLLQSAHIFEVLW